MANFFQARPDYRYEICDFDCLEGWQNDDHAAALQVFFQTCDALPEPERSLFGAYACTGTDAKTFFETHFCPIRICDGSDAKFTGYFEPELNGSPVKTPRFRFPLHRLPSEISEGSSPWVTRRDILTTDVLQGKGSEICWVDDPVALFFLQVQGSGRIRYPDGMTIRVGYAGTNGRRYRSIGKELTRRGVYTPAQLTADILKNWIRRNPIEGKELMMHNESYVFFREITGVSADKGPIGTMQRSLTPMRSIAVDPEVTPLGSPVWLESDGRQPSGPPNGCTGYWQCHQGRTARRCVFRHRAGCGQSGRCYE